MNGILTSNEVGWALMQAGLSPFTLDTEMFQIVRKGRTISSILTGFRKSISKRRSLWINSSTKMRIGSYALPWTELTSAGLLL